MQHDFGQGFIASALSQHCAAVKGDFLVFVTKIRILSDINKNSDKTNRMATDV